MGKNTKLILRDEQSLIFKPKAFKLSTELINNNLDLTATDFNVIGSQGLSLVDIQNNPIIIPGRNLTALLSSFYDLSLNLANPTTKNQVVFFSDINAIRNSIAENNDSLIIAGGETLEKIPVHKHINETFENLTRMRVEYTTKLSNIDNFRLNMFDPEYATLMYKFGRATEVSLIDGKLDSTNVPISGYIKVEDANENITLNLVLRGIPLPMRKTLTSLNTDGTKNYFFTYPQYLIDNIELVESIQYIEVNSSGINAKFFYGSTYTFENLNPVGYDKAANLNIVNKEFRNIPELIPD
jgi:hypothetical protein